MRVRESLLTAALVVSTVGCATASSPFGSGSNTSPRATMEICLDQVFGDPLEWRYAGGEGVVVAIRALDNCDLDRQVLLSRVGGQPLDVDLRTSRDHSIGEQLDRLREGSDHVDTARACQAIEVRRIEPKQEALDQWSSLMDALDSVSLKPTLGYPLVLHGNQYKVWIFSAGNHSYFEFSGTPGESSESDGLKGWVDTAIQLAGFSCDT